MATEKPTSAEAEGTTLGEAKWHAVKALEPDFPGVGADCVSFEVLDEGDDAGGHPARVRVQLDLEAWERMAHEIPEEPAERVPGIDDTVHVTVGGMNACALLRTKRVVCWGSSDRGELGVGRQQIQYLASIFHPDTPNDVAPSGYNDPSVPDGLATSPLEPKPADAGFRWA